MRNINWDSVQENQPGDFNNPEPGGYIAVIVSVEDHEDKECLEIRWDFPTGDYRGANQETFSRAGFWPITLWRSYKDAALGFFKAFKTAIERSNSGYIFQCADVRGLVGKRMGVVLGEEEYLNKHDELKTRLYVYQVRSISEIQARNYNVPELKKLSNASGRQYRQQQQQQYPASYGGEFVPCDDDDGGNLPF